MPNLKARVGKLRAQVELLVIAGEFGYLENCICFPQSKDTPRRIVAAQLIFGSSEELLLALSIPCPLHGNRFDPARVVVIYAALWVRDRNWESQWDQFPAQHRKALQATFKTREEYVAEK